MKEMYSVARHKTGSTVNYNLWY